MLSNAYFLAKFRFDTAENEPAKNLQNFAKNLLIFQFSHFQRRRCSRKSPPTGRTRSRSGGPGSSPWARSSADLTALDGPTADRQISAKCCSFSAVSAPIFARKYAFCSICQNLPDYQAEIFEIWQILQILRHLQNFC